MMRARLARRPRCSTKCEGLHVCPTCGLVRPEQIRCGFPGEGIEAMPRQTILVVDDEAPMRSLLSSNLKASSYAVRSAADGSEAVKIIEEHPLDLVLLDINAPGPHPRTASGGHPAPWSSGTQSALS
jgi:Response regulator receiver domain